jgi:hypothetical protein
MVQHSSDFQALTKQFNRLIDQIDSVDVRVPEDSALISLAADLVPGVTRLLREAATLLGRVEEIYGPDQFENTNLMDSEGDSLRGIGFQIATELAARDLSDVAFFARTDLRGSLDQLVAAATRKRGEQLTLASHCESGMRRVRKALVSVESALYEFEAREPPVRRWFDVELSLQIRKLYWNLRRETGGDAADQDRSLEARLRSVLYRVVAFRELRVYPFLRVEDRVTLRRLLSQILDWLNGDLRDPSAGERLWQDLAAFAELLVQVSHRQELQDHDLGMVGKAWHVLFPYGDSISEVPDDLVDELQALLGLDDDLDRLILARDRQPGAWREVLEQLRKRLGRVRLPAGHLDLFADDATS